LAHDKKYDKWHKSLETKLYCLASRLLLYDEICPIGCFDVDTVRRISKNYDTGLRTMQGFPDGLFTVTTPQKMKFWKDTSIRSG